MNNDVTQRLAQPARRLDQMAGERARSVPHKQTYVKSILLSIIHYLCLIAAVTALSLFFINPSTTATKLFIGFLGISGLTWILAFFRRRHTHCPLCKGTPLMTTGALVHRKATRIFPFNHGTSAVLSILLTQKFRCMYCGTLFDILKTPSHKLTNTDMGEYYSTYTSDKEEEADA